MESDSIVLNCGRNHSKGCNHIDLMIISGLLERAAGAGGPFPSNIFFLEIAGQDNGTLTTDMTRILLFWRPVT